MHRKKGGAASGDEKGVLRMGGRFEAVCEKCEERFFISKGGGFNFHLLHCDKCGKENSISFDKLGEVHFRYIKGLDTPYSVATSSSDLYIQQNYTGKPISEKEYHKSVERIVGKCKCGGQFKFDAPPRCPKCRSSNLSIRKSPLGQYD